jgi:sugar phosphate isomerase/epimerase
MSIPFSIRQHGFHNISGPGGVTGFQLLVQSPYYRGVWFSLIEGVDVTVDGETFDNSKTRFKLGERTYTWAEMETIGDKLWPWLEPATVIVDKPGGLKPGVHDVAVVIKIRISYMPFNPVGHFANAKLVLMPTAPELAALPKPRLAASLYSYNGDLQAGTMTLEQCLGDLADMGAEGFEFLPEAIIPGYPNPSEAWLKQWFAWLEKYKLTPIAVDGSCDTKLYKSRKLTAQEIADLIIADLKLAHRLGCKGYRGMGSSWPAALGVSGNVSVKSEWTTGITPFEIYDKVLPTAEKLDVRIGEELHIPFLIKSEWLHQTIDYINKRSTRHLGFVPDMSIFVRRPPKSLDPEQFVQRGLARKVVDYILQAREQLVPEHEAKSKVQEMGGGTPALQLTAMIYHLSYSTRERNEPEQLKELIPYIVHIHGKCYEIAEDLSDENSIPYNEIVPVLACGGYNGFISTEYEGDRAPYAASQQVRRQQLMIRQQWAKALHATAAGF